MNYKFLKSTLLILCFLSAHQSIGQSVSNVLFDFDKCDFSESTGVLNPGIIAGDPECICGLKGNSLYLNGNDTLVFPDSLSKLFLQESFTFDFYFTIEDPGREMDIFSASTNCSTSDSTMYFKYLGSTGELFFVLASNINNILTVRTFLDKQLCWHRFTLVKEKTEYFYYLNNQLIKRFVSRENIPLGTKNPFRFGINPCSLAGTSPFIGQFDEISWSNRSLSQLELQTSYRFPDQIITRDTTIFSGASVNISVGNSCGQNVVWNPTDELDVSNVFSPVAKPSETTTYTSTIQYRHCTILDTVRIYVVDRDNLDCSKILLPKAFTPNQDGLNDTYGISNLFILESFEFLEVLDRSGALLWKTDSQAMMWDGSFKGEPVSSGVYFYKVKYSCNNQDFFKVDSFSLIR